MVISALIEHLESIKSRYGDCRVFVLSKSFYEGGTIIDAQDVLLTSLTHESSNEKEVIAMISNCPVVGAEPGTKEDVERILGKAGFKRDHTADTKLPPLVFQPQEFIQYFLMSTDRYYVDFDDVNQFAEFINRSYRLGAFVNHQSVTVDLDHNSFLRTADILSDVFDRVGDRLYIRSDDAFNRFIQTNGEDDFISNLVGLFLAETEDVKERTQNDDT